MTDAPAPITLPPHVEMKPIDSSHHSRAGYDAEAQHLYIDFAKPGADKPNIYRYGNVTPADHAAYIGSESKGKHFLAHIKPHTQKHPYDKVAHVEAS